MIRTCTIMILLGGLMACGEESATRLVLADATNLPVAGLSARWSERFYAGDEGFDQVFRAEDGLGPVYIQASCAACHAEDGKGPGVVTKMVQVEADGWTPRVAQELPWGHTVRPRVAVAGQNPVLPPAQLEGLKLSQRIGPAVFGRGLMEAVADDAICAQEAAQATGAYGIHGRINWVTRVSEENVAETLFHRHVPGERLIGRFGLKARLPDVDDFVADAYVNDMGLTSPLRPREIASGNGMDHGVDLPASTINFVADYVRLLALPRRAAADPEGARLFAAVACATCHVPSMPTRADYPIEPLAGRDAPLYSDMLVHDMGDLLADGMVEGMAGGRDWRTAPLIGLRHLGSYLHDGRAAGVREAVEMHGGPGSEANESVRRFAALDAADQGRLLRFVEGL